LVQRKKVSRRRHQNRRYLWRFSHASFLDSVVRKDSRRAQSVMRWNRFEVAPADIRNLFVEMQQLHLDMGVAFDTCVAAPLLHITGFAEGWPTLPFQTPHAATARCSGRLNEQGKKANKTKVIHYERALWTNHRLSSRVISFVNVLHLLLPFSTSFHRVHVCVLHVRNINPRPRTSPLLETRTLPRIYRSQQCENTRSEHLDFFVDLEATRSFPVV
jgi:hypothetical protein